MPVTNPAGHHSDAISCVRMYVADRRPEDERYAFVFEVHAGRTRFTAYSGDPDRFRLNGEYRLAIIDPS